MVSVTATEVLDNPAASRYEIRVDGELIGFSDYTLHGAVIDFVHTEVAESFRHRGLATQLVRAALDDSRRMHREVLPHCAFVHDFIDRTPEYSDLIPAARRAQFGADGDGASCRVPL